MLAMFQRIFYTTLMIVLLSVVCGCVWAFGSELFDHDFWSIPRDGEWLKAMILWPTQIVMFIVLAWIADVFASILTWGIKR